jgi:signal transduction histidine kinase
LRSLLSAFTRNVLLSILLFCCFAAPKVGFSLSADTLKPKNVLMLFSLEPSQPVYEKIIETIKSKIKKEYAHPLNFYMDFVELSRFNSDEHLTDFFDYYKKKYFGREFDLLISIGPNLHPIVRKYGSPFLDEIPTVFFEIDFSSINKPYTINRKNETALFLDIDVKGHIDYALKLFPGTKNIFLISGSSQFDSLFTDLYDQVLKSYRNDYDIEWYRGLSVTELIPRVEKLPPNSLIFVNSYQNDNSGKSFYSREVIRSIRNYASAPLFFIFDPGLEGTVGGLIINSAKLGEKVAEYSLRIINGESPGSIETYHGSFQDYMFDWKQLKKWNIDENKLPPGSIIINKEYSFTELYWSYMIAGAVFFVIETALVIILIFLYRKQKRQSEHITEQENRYKLLVDYNRLTELNELTASLSHELNQPLTAILSSSQAAQRFLANNGYERVLFDEILANIVHDVKRASGIMNSLRSMIKKETREKKRVNLNSITHDVFQLFRSQAVIKEIEAEVDYDESEPFIMADSILIQQVILNLLLNASEALERKSTGYKVIFMKTGVTGNIVKVSVSDNGPGVNDELKNEIFKPFFSTKYTGLGIGLAICRSIIEDHEGKLIYEKNESGGATFSFNLKVIK